MQTQFGLSFLAFGFGFKTPAVEVVIDVTQFTSSFIFKRLLLRISAHASRDVFNGSNADDAAARVAFYVFACMRACVRAMGAMGAVRTLSGFDG